MFNFDACAVLDSREIDSESFWFSKSRQEHPDNVPAGGWKGSACIGEHGPEFAPQKERPVEAEAILDCGHRLQFTVAPVTGESIYCSRCDSWERCRVPGGFLFRCVSCNSEPEAHWGHNSVLVMARARKHAQGSRGNRKDAPHVVEIGRYTENEIIWKQYVKGIEL